MDVEEEATSVEARADVGDVPRSGEKHASTFRSGVADVSESLDGRAWRNAEVEGRNHSQEGGCDSHGTEAEDRGWPSSSRRTVDDRRNSESEGRGEFGGETEGKGRTGSRMAKTDNSGDGQYMTDAKRPEQHRSLDKWEIGNHLIGERVKVHWPEDKSWWSGEVVEVGPHRKSITVLYESGELEKISGSDMKEVLSKGHLLVKCTTQRPVHGLGIPMRQRQTTERAVDSSNDRVVTSAFPSPRHFNIPIDRQEHESVCDMPPTDAENGLAPPSFMDGDQKPKDRQMNLQCDSSDRNIVLLPQQSLQDNHDREEYGTTKPATKSNNQASLGRGGLIAVGSKVLAGVRIGNSHAGKVMKQIKAESTADGGEYQARDGSAEFDWRLHLQQSKKRGRAHHKDRGKAKLKTEEGSLVSDPGATWDPPDSGRTECIQHTQREATSAGRAMSMANFSHDSRRSPFQSGQPGPCIGEAVSLVPQSKQEVSYQSDAEHAGQKLEAEVSLQHNQSAGRDVEDSQQCQGKEAPEMELMDATRGLFYHQEDSAGLALRAIHADSNITDAQHPLEPEHTIVTDVGTIHGVGVSAGEPVPSTAHAYSDDSKSAMARSNIDTSVVSSDARVMV